MLPPVGGNLRQKLLTEEQITTVSFSYVSFLSGGALTARSHIHCAFIFASAAHRRLPSLSLVVQKATPSAAD
jgi:hypothetical protein